MSCKDGLLGFLYKPRKGKISKKQKQPYLTQYHSKFKSKGTLLSPTFKVGEKKVAFFFPLWPYLKRYGHFVIFRFSILNLKNRKLTKWPYLFKYGSMEKKLRPLCFLQLSKLEKTKWSSFFHYGHI